MIICWIRTKFLWHLSCDYPKSVTKKRLEVRFQFSPKRWWINNFFCLFKMIQKNARKWLILDSKIIIITYLKTFVTNFGLLRHLEFDLKCVRVIFVYNLDIPWMLPFDSSFYPPSYVAIEIIYRLKSFITNLRAWRSSILYISKDILVVLPKLKMFLCWNPRLCNVDII